MIRRFFIVGAIIAASLIMATPGFAQYYPRSGYTTTTQVVGSKQVFVRHQFLERDFTNWLSVVYQAQAIEQFNSWVSSGILDKQGHVLLAQLTIGGKIFSYSQKIDFEDIQQNMTPTYSASDIFKSLVQANVLDKSGFLIGVTGNKNIEFETTDFSSVLPRLQTITLPISNEKVQGALINELNMLILNIHRSIEVTTQDTTRYQSRSSNLFNGLIETIAGNWLAKIFSPDQTNISRTEYRYFPSIYLPDFYSFHVGFSNGSLDGQKPGFWSINGNSSLTEINGQLLSKNDIQFSDWKATYRWLPFGRPRYSNEFSFVSLQGRYSRIQTANGNTHFASVGIPFISFGGSSKGSLSELSTGLTYSKATNRDALGFYTALDMRFFPLNWLSLDFNGSYSFQPDFGKNNLWDQAQGGIGVSVYPFPQVSAQVSYRWLGSSTNTNTDGFSFGITYGFQP